MDLSLQQKIDRSGGAVQMLRNSQIGPYAFPMAQECSNWRDEQRAWRESVALIDQTHMIDLYVEGPDAVRLVSDLSINSFAGFGRNKAKQMVCCGPSGHLIGDMILFGLADDRLCIVGRPTVAGWVEFHAVTGGYDVHCERDSPASHGASARRTFRYELQGPKAWALLEKLNGRPIDLPGFFRTTDVTVAGHKLRALRHGMSGAPGLEFWGPATRGPEVRAAILAAGEEFGLRQIGGRAYASAAVDSGWMPSPMPALYSGEETRSFREWASADSFEGIASLGGSFVSDRIEDYYFTPWDLDYGRLLRVDHDFIGRAALERMADARHRCKVSLVWNADDVAAVYRSLMEPGNNGKFMDMPDPLYASFPYDRLVDGRGGFAGVSTYAAFIAPDFSWVSLGVVEAEHAVEGAGLTLIWGEPDGGSRRPTVERHVQKEIRVTVTGWPFSKQARERYRARPGGAGGKEGMTWA
jgi:syringate O-demethylase/vanillate/3-O-methylgallate O-demethylase